MQLQRGGLSVEFPSVMKVQAVDRVSKFEHSSMKRGHVIGQCIKQLAVCILCHRLVKGRIKCELAPGFQRVILVKSGLI